MEHKAFVFDFVSFENELRSLLERALETGSVVELSRFIETNREALTDPNEGEPLDEQWKELIEVADPHQYGDFALTKYYRSRDDIGLSYAWESVREKLLERLGNDAPLLGITVGPVDNAFDPGKMGSYFQSASQVAANLDALRQMPTNESEPGIERLRDLLKAAVGKGLYITF